MFLPLRLGQVFPFWLISTSDNHNYESSGVGYPYKLYHLCMGLSVLGFLLFFFLNGGDNPFKNKGGGARVGSRKLDTTYPCG